MLMRWLIYSGALIACLWAQTALPQEIRVTDARGQKIVLNKPAERIIALAPHIVENLFSAGAGDKLIGVASYSDYPAAAKQLPQVGSFAVINVEQILAMQPDLIIGWQSGNRAEGLQQLENLGLTVYLDEPHTLEDVAKSIRHFGTLAGTEQSSETVTADYLQRIAALRDKYQQRTPVSVLYQVWHDPLQTLNDQHLVSDMIRLCGGRNLYADAVTLAPKINIESVLVRDPQAIVASGNNKKRPPWLDNWRQYSGLTAVKHDNLFAINPDWLQRHTLRTLQGAEQLCQNLNTARQRLYPADS